MTRRLQTVGRIRRILAIKLGHLGDVLLMTPALDLLQRAFPEAEISVLLRRSTDAMLRGNPRVREIIIGADLGKKTPLRQRAPWQLRLIQRLRQSRFDLAINFSAADRGAIVALLSGAPHRVGYAAISRGFWGRDKLYTHLCRRDWLRLHTVLKDAQLVCDFVSAQGIAGFDAPQQVTGALTFNCSDAAVVFARDLWRQHAAKNAPRIVIHPTSRWLFKCWSDQNVAALADRLQVGLGASVVLTTGPDAKEIARGKAILALSRSAPRACLGNLTIEQLAAAIQQAHLFIGVDSAPMHLAAAVGTPVVALFGPSLEALWHPWTTHHILLRQPCPCILANQIACDKSRTVQCMAALSVEEVFNAAAKLLSRC